MILLSFFKDSPDSPDSRFLNFSKTIMKTTTTILCASLCLASFAQAQIPVTDGASIGANELSWADNVRKWKTSFDKANQQIRNQKDQLSKMSTELKRMGDPASLVGNLDLKGLTQLSSSTQLAKSYQGYTTDAQKNPLATLQRSGSGGFSAPSKTLSNGSTIQRDANSYRQFATHGAIVDDYRTRSPQLASSRKKIQEEMDQTAKDLNAASTDTQVARLQGRMAILQGQQEQLSREETLAAAQSTIETNDVEMSRRAQAQAQAEAFDQERQAVLTAATQGSVPEPKSAKNVE